MVVKLADVIFTLLIKLTDTTFTLLIEVLVGVIIVLLLKSYMQMAKLASIIFTLLIKVLIDMAFSYYY